MYSQSKAIPKPVKRQGLASLWPTIPLALVLVAVGVSLLHIFPLWLAQSATPPGWTFTGNLSVSPDHMQYRVWARQAPSDGPIISNRFTSEPNNPHLVVFFYYLVGQISLLVGAAPEFVYSYTGIVLAFFFCLTLFATVRHFTRTRVQTWTVFIVLLFGGGLGAHLLILSRYSFIQNNPLLKRTMVEGLWSWPVFEDYRGNYIVNTLFDTHFLLIWLSATAAMLALYLSLSKFSAWRILSASTLFLLATIFHLYEGVTLVAIAFGIGVLYWYKGHLDRPSLVSLVLPSMAAVAALVWQLALYQGSNLPLPSWRGVNLLLSTVLLAYPVAWLLIALGITDYWRTAGQREVFLLGWALGCLAVTFSGPFYPYPDRGTMTLQIPLYLIAGAIYFTRYRRLTWRALLIGVLLLGVTPLREFENQWENGQFRQNTPAIFLTGDHLQHIKALAQTANHEDLLIANMTRADWASDLLWLAPEFPGKFYCGHFFLTVDYRSKCDEVVRFYTASPEKQLEFLDTKGVRFVYVTFEEFPQRFADLPGMSVLSANPTGTVLEYSPNAPGS